MDYTGTGNTLNVYHPQVLKLVMDSLRYWVTEMHVDGFRFDLASTLARELHDVNKLGAFFDTIHQDPTLADVKLIAEPWDVGEGGYQVGNFPVLVGGVERQVSRHGAAILEGRQRTAFGLCLSPDRVERFVPERRTQHLRRRSTSLPRMTDSRCAISSATTRNTTKPTATTTKMAPTITIAGTWARRSDR